MKDAKPTLASDHPVVLLAGGRGSRAGAPKGLIEIEGRSWLSHQLEGLARASLRYAILVLGHEAARYQSLLSSQSLIPDTLSLEFALNPEPELGHFSSLCVGLKHALKCYPDAMGFFVLPIDVPVPSREVWEALARAQSVALKALTPETPLGGGHPVLLSRGFVEHLLTIPEGATQARLDGQIRALPSHQRARVSVSDPRVSTNLNQVQDWRQLQEMQLI